jgi:hypothetical protein
LDNTTDSWREKRSGKMKSLSFDRCACLAVAMLMAAGAAQANVVTIYNTGYDGTQLISGGQPDPNYRLVIGGTTANVGVETSIPPSWLHVDPATSISAWIGPNSDGSIFGDADTNYTYRTTFDLSGFDPTTVVITGQWATDDSGYIKLNNDVTSITSTGFGAWAQFTLSSSDFQFESGINTLDFVVHNGPSAPPNPTGLRVEFTTADATATPEPASLLMIGAGLIALGALRRRRA